MSLLLSVFKNQIDKFKKNLWLSSVGARVCYNKGDASEILLSDYRVISNEDRAKFLKKLGFQYYHTSVFAHSFVYFKVNQIPYSYLPELNLDLEQSGKLFALSLQDTDLTQAIYTALLGSNYFKSIALPDKHIIGLSFRHFIEDTDLDFSKELHTLIEEAEDPNLDEVIGLDDFINKKRKASLLYLDKAYKGWAVFLVQDVSRALTHQLVRHTRLNFSQRSQRYIKEEAKDKYVYPKVEGKAREVFKDFYRYTDTIYNLLIDQYKIKKEDARFVLPNATKTVIMFSATIDDIKDFVIKRRIKQAQWEIRELAEEMQDLLKQGGIRV